VSLNKPELKIPKTETGADELGIRYEGSVLNGLLGLKEKLERQAVFSNETSAQIREIAPGGVKYIDPFAQTPSGHGYQLEPDLVYANQRSQLRHPSLADPVIRHHLNLPPLPDPYDEIERRREYWERERAKHLPKP